MAEAEDLENLRTAKAGSGRPQYHGRSKIEGSRGRAWPIKLGAGALSACVGDEDDSVRIGGAGHPKK
jgi:hypothetical protein